MKRALRFIAVVGLIRLSTVAQQPPADAPSISGPDNPPQLEPSDEMTQRLEREKLRQRETKWNVRTDVLMVAIPQSQALPLIADLQSDDDRKTEPAFTKILAMISANEATLMGWPSVATLDGQRAVMETIVEKRYPTEYQPPLSAPSDPKLVDQGLNSALPEAFETRNVGVTLEVETAVLDDGKRLLVELVPQRVALIGWNAYKVGKKDVGMVDIQQPEFASTKVTTALSMRNDARILIAVHRLEMPADHIELFILHARATPVK